MRVRVMTKPRADNTDTRLAGPPNSSGIVKRIASAIVGARRRWIAAVAFSLVFGVVSTAFIVPAGAAGLRLFLARWGRASVGNFEVAAFLLSPGGLLALAWLGGLTLATLNLELGGLGLLLRSTTLRSWQALWLLRRRVLTLVGIGLMEFGLLLLLSLPFVGACWVVYAWWWKPHDIYALVMLRPPVFWQGAAVGAAIASGYATVAAWLLVRWSLAPFVVVMEPCPGIRGALERSAAITRGSRLSIVRATGLLALLVFGCGAVVLGAIDTAAGLMLSRLGDTLMKVLVITAAVLALQAAAALIVSAVSRAALASVLLGYFLERSHNATMPSAPPDAFSVRRTWLAALAGVAALSIWTGYSLMSDLELSEHVELTAHRAGKALAPENTLAALRQAIADGADWAEIDVILTSDGGVVVLHDTDLWRVGGVRRRVAEMTLAEVTAIDVGSWFDPSFAGERVPTLDQMLTTAGNRIRLTIELKFSHPSEVEPLVRATVEAVARAGMIDRSRICSQSYDSLMRVRALEPRLPVGFIAGAALGDLSRLKVDFLMVSQRLATRRRIESARARGMDVHVWTITNPDHLPPLLDLGVVNIITDHPRRMRQRLDEIRAMSVPERLLLRAGHGIVERSAELLDASEPRENDGERIADP